MNKYHKPNWELSYIKLSNFNHHCKYFLISTKTKPNKLFEVKNNFPIKHWWQYVVVEIVEC